MSEMTPEKLKAQVETVDLINTEVTAALAQQADASAKIETKAVVLVGYTGALSAFLATRHAQPVLAALAYIAYAVAASFGITAFMFAQGYSTLVPRNLFNAYLERPKADTLATLAATRVQLFEINALKLRTKARYAQASLAALVIGVPLMVASIIVTAGHHVVSAPNEETDGSGGGMGTRGRLSGAGASAIAQPCPCLP